MLKKQRGIEAEILDQLRLGRQAGGIARLPIAEAKKKLLHEAFRSAPAAPAEAWIGTHAPARGESSGGREIPEASQSSQSAEARRGAERPAGYASQRAVKATSMSTHGCSPLVACASWSSCALR